MCAFEDCNRLEFRTAGYCLNHTDNSLDENQIEIPHTLQQRNLMESQILRRSRLVVPHFICLVNMENIQRVKLFLWMDGII